MSYVAGVLDGWYLRDDEHLTICEPNDVTNGQEGLIVLKYLRDHPEELHLKAAALVIKAMGKAFPCK
jgi:hypothetical protein